MDYNIKISKELYDAKHCDDKDLCLTGGTNLFKIKMEGNYSITIPGGEFTASKTIYHNLGYEPAVLVFGQIDEFGSRQRLPSSLRLGLGRHYCDIYSDRIVITVIDSCSPTDTECLNRIQNTRTFTGYYYIFFDQVSS